MVRYIRWKLGNMLAGKEINRTEDGIVRADYGSKGSSKNKNV